MGKKTKQLIKTHNLLSFWDVTQCSLVQLPQLLGRFPMKFLQSTSRHHCIKITCLHIVESPAQERRRHTQLGRHYLRIFIFLFPDME
jgi:hypothetical protein